VSTRGGRGARLWSGLRSNSTLSILALLDATAYLAADAGRTKHLQVFLRIQAAPRQGDNVVELKVLRSATMLVLRTRTMRVFGSIGIVLRATEETQSPSLDNLIPS
jgi:hypothetical protein